MAQQNTEILLSQFDIDPVSGFLPTRDPLKKLPDYFAAWDTAAAQLPKMLVTTKTRSLIEQLPVLDPQKLSGAAELERAMLVLSYLGHGYVWAEGKPAERLPRSLAVPWFEVSKHLGRPPVLSYASYALHNWQRLDPQGPVENGNIALLQNFFGGADEEWFVLVHVDIEKRSGAAIAGVAAAHNAAIKGDLEGIEKELGRISASLADAYHGLERMTELCDPYIYYHRVRPYIHGWKNHPVLKSGLIYDGVDHYKGQPQQFRGETGAQSSIIPSLDAVLGVVHQDDPLRPYLLEMQDYMPPKHRAFIKTLESGPSVRPSVIQHKDSRPALKEIYNSCVDWVEKFRSLHLKYAADYIFKQAQTSSANPSAVGTGGTPFMPYLSKHRDETGKHRIA